LLKSFEITDDFEAINISSSISVTIKDVLDVILKVDNNQSANVKYDASMQTMIPKRLINTDKIRKKCDWKPEVSLIKGIKLTINCYKELYKDTIPENKYDNL